MKHPSAWAVGALAASCLACLGPREPGPLEKEWGKVLFWEVTDLDSSAEGCTDANGFAESLALPSLSPDTYFILRVSDDGRTATATDCSKTRAESCTDLDDFVFTIDGHTLEHTDPPVSVDADPDCEVSVVTVWTMIDDGDVGGLEVSLTFPFDGEDQACADLDAAIADQGTNGDGLASCEARLTAELTFDRAD